MTEIKLDISVQELRSIYYRNGSQKYFFGPQTKRESTYLVIALIAFPFYVLKTIDMEDECFFILGSIIFCLFVYDWWRVAKPIIDWKKSVEIFLKNAGAISNLTFKYNELFFTHIQDNQELKQNWEIIERAVVNEQYIWLFSNTNVLLPKNSMSDEEFTALTHVVVEKVKNVEKESREGQI